MVSPPWWRGRCRWRPSVNADRETYMRRQDEDHDLLRQRTQKPRRAVGQQPTAIQTIGDRPFPTKEQQAELESAAATIEKFLAADLDLGPMFEMGRRQLLVAESALRDAAIWAHCMTRGPDEAKEPADV